MFYRINYEKEIVKDLADHSYADDCLYSSLCTTKEYLANPRKWIIGDVEQEIDVLEWEKKTIEVPVIDPETGEPTGETETIEVDDHTKPIMIEIVDPVTGEKREVQKSHKETVIVKLLILNPDYENEIAAKREADFNKAFFHTSLGYIRRAVTMKDGSKKDFLGDLLLPIKAGLELGQVVTVLTYDMPPFDRDVEDWTEYQHEKAATAAFVGECLNQLVTDFSGS